MDSQRVPAAAARCGTDVCERRHEAITAHRVPVGPVGARARVSVGTQTVAFVSHQRGSRDA
jgi:hypothetical protein